MSNLDPRLLAYRRRLIELEDSKRIALEDIKELRQEYRSKGLTSDEIRGVSLSVRRHFEDADKKVHRTKAEEIADALDLSDTSFQPADGAGELNDA